MGHPSVRAEVRCGDARDVLATLDDASVDAVVTDPPYALTDKQGGAKGFMGARWDTGQVAHDAAFWAEVLRVAKPGAFLLAFGGTRTYHRLACAIEDAGWECRDMIMWHYGSGFPKSKSCLKPAHEPILLAKAPGPLRPLRIDTCRVPTGADDPNRRDNPGRIMRPNHVYGPESRSARAPTLQQGRWPSNLVLSHHPECQPAGVRRVRGDHKSTRGASTHVYGNGTGFTPATGEPVGYADADGYESVDAYQCVDGCPVAELDRQAGPRTSGGYPPEGGQRSHVATYGQPTARGAQRLGASTGRASRFFPTFGPDPEDAVPFRYCSKASRRERNAGLDGLPERRSHSTQRTEVLQCSCGNKTLGASWPTCPRCGADMRDAGRVERDGLRAANHHPTVKPTALMAWLCTLVTPPGGTVLDCFAGSGSTGVACVREGFGFIGIEQDAGYVEIARRRIAHEQEQHAGPLFAGVGPATSAAREA